MSVENLLRCVKGHNCPHCWKVHVSLLNPKIFYSPIVRLPRSLLKKLKWPEGWITCPKHLTCPLQPPCKKDVGHHHRCAHRGGTLTRSNQRPNMFSHEMQKAGWGSEQPDPVEDLHTAGGGSTRQPLKVPSTPDYSMILWNAAKPLQNFKVLQIQKLNSFISKSSLC